MAKDTDTPDEEPTEETPRQAPEDSASPPPADPVPSAAWAPPPPPHIKAEPAPVSSAPWAPPPPPAKKLAISQLIQRKLSLPVWAIAAAAVVLLVLGGVIGSVSGSGEINKLKDDKEALERKNDRLQGGIDDRESARAADEAEAERIEAEQAEEEREAQRAAEEAAREAERVAAEGQARQQAEAEAAAAAAAEAERRRNTVDVGGIYAIGPDINPGQWRTAGPDATGFCYYAILNSPDTFDIATNSISEGPSIAQLPEGKYFETSGCQTWTRA
ncbi:MAG: hypothetical protein ACR2IN_00190 [Thermoleophilaceae bacterium]